MATRGSKLQNVSVLGNKTVLQYDASADTFKLVSADDVLDKSSEDGNIPDTFVDQVEEQISIENIQILGIDGGIF